MTNADVLALSERLDELKAEHEKAKAAYEKARAAEHRAEALVRAAEQVSFVYKGVALNEGPVRPGCYTDGDNGRLDVEACGHDITRTAHVEHDKWGDRHHRFTMTVVEEGAYRPRVTFKFADKATAIWAAREFVATGKTPDDGFSPVPHDLLQKLQDAVTDPELRSAVYNLRTHFFPY